MFPRGPVRFLVPNVLRKNNLLSTADCDRPQILINAFPVYSSTRYTSTARYQCDTAVGHFRRGIGQSTCTRPEGQWTDAALWCKMGNTPFHFVL